MKLASRAAAYVVAGSNALLAPALLRRRRYVAVGQAQAPVTLDTALGREGLSGVDRGVAVGPAKAGRIGNGRRS